MRFLRHLRSLTIPDTTCASPGRDESSAESRCETSRGRFRLGRGTKLAEHAGPITASLNKDKEIESSGVDYRALWCPALMENMLGNIQSIKNQGTFFSSMAADLKTPQAATEDIAAMSAKFPIDRTWTGQGGHAVLGPEDLSYNNLANIISLVLDKPVHYRQLPPEASRLS